MPVSAPSDGTRLIATASGNWTSFLPICSAIQRLPFSAMLSQPLSKTLLPRRKPCSSSSRFMAIRSFLVFSSPVLSPGKAKSVASPIKAARAYRFFRISRGLNPAPLPKCRANSLPCSRFMTVPAASAFSRMASATVWCLMEPNPFSISGPMLSSGCAIGCVPRALTAEGCPRPFSMA